MSITRQTSLPQEYSGELRFGGARMVVLDIESSYWGLRRQLEGELKDPRLIRTVRGRGYLFAS
jgi:DNA-binding response OmpR family regulator